jgi:hypothetical protein
MEQQRNYTVKQFRPKENCWQSGIAHSYYAAAPVGSPPPQPTGGFTTFPDSATKIFVLPQNMLTLAFHATKLQPTNFQAWKRLRRIFAMLAKERKEAKDALWEFLGLEDDDDDEVGICAKVLMMQNWLKKCLEYLQSKPPPAQVSTVWCALAVPRLSRAPNMAACLAWRVAG